jgi:hypothetical protein
MHGFKLNDYTLRSLGNMGQLCKLSLSVTRNVVVPLLIQQTNDFVGKERVGDGRGMELIREQMIIIAGIGWKDEGMSEDYRWHGYVLPYLGVEIEHDHK